MNIYLVKSAWTRRHVEANNIPGAVKKFKAATKKDHPEVKAGDLEPTDVHLIDTDPVVK